MRRIRRWALGVIGVAAGAFLALALYGGWRPLAGTDGLLLGAIPGDVDAACRLDARALRSSPLLADSALATALADALDLPEDRALLDPLLGDDVALALRDGSWLAVVRVAGPLHGARLGMARALLKMSGDGPVLETTTPAGDTVHVARHGRDWIVSDDEDLAAEALACAEGRAAPVTSRLDLDAAFDAAHTASIWISDDGASFVLDTLRAWLGEIAPVASRSVHEADSTCTLAIDTDPSELPAAAAFAWRCSRDDVANLTFRADLADLARRTEDGAITASPPPPRAKPSDRVKLTIELSRAGMSGDRLREEVARRMADRAAARVPVDAAAALLAARRRAALLRALGILYGDLVIADGRARLQLRFSRSL